LATPVMETSRVTATREQTPLYTVDGLCVQADTRVLARKVAYLPQTPPPADGMTVRELVALGRYPWHGALGRYTQNDAQKVADAMALTGVPVCQPR
jgi:ABC-type cobalamin/Fe3+-siderophores transport system ATPase subunit